MFHRSMAFIIGMATRLQDIIEPYHIRFYIGIRVNDRITYTCLSCKIHHNLWSILVKYFIN